jgi:hypothetical protein
MGHHAQKRTAIVVKKPQEPVPKEETKKAMSRVVSKEEDDELISDIMKSDSAPTDKTIGTKHST